MTEILEGATFNTRNNDFYFSLEKETLEEVGNGKEKNLTLYNDTIEDIQGNTKKELKLGLLSSEERSKLMLNAIIPNNIQNLTDVEIKISNELIENILNYENNNTGNAYEHRYNGRDKIHFYIHDSLEKEVLKYKLQTLEEEYNKKFKKQ